MPQVYIVVLNYKNWEDTLECLESLFRSSYQYFSVLVIDNDSQNNSLGHLMEWADKGHGKSASFSAIGHTFLRSEDIPDLVDLNFLPRLTFIQHSFNAGFAGGNNIALRLLQTEEAYIWLVNPDIVIQENTLEELVKFAVLQSPDAIIGGVIQSRSGNRDVIVYGGAKVNFLAATVTPVKKPGFVGRLDYVSGGCLFTHSSNLKRLGLLPEEYFLYWEETDWCYRAKQKGQALHVCPKAVCYDKGSTSIGKNFIADYYYARNGLLFISKFRRKNIPFVVFFLGIRLFKRLITGRWERAKGIYRGTLDFFKMQSDDAK